MLRIVPPPSGHPIVEGMWRRVCLSDRDGLRVNVSYVPSLGDSFVFIR